MKKEKGQIIEEAAEIVSKMSIKLLEESWKHNYKNQFTSMIGIKPQDEDGLVMFTAYYAQRLLRLRIYNDNFDINEPETDAMRKAIPFINKYYEWKSRFNDQDKGLLEVIEKTTDNVKNKYFITEEQKIRARNIELSVNDLFSRATADNADRVKINYTPQILDQWSAVWRPIFSAE